MGNFTIGGVEIGHASVACGKPASDDFFDFACPSPDELARRGLVCALADGSSATTRAGMAAQLCVRTAVLDYYAMPPSWDVARTLDRIIGSMNAWMLASNRRGGEAQAMLSTVTVLVLAGDRMFLAHVGNARVLRVRDGCVEQLTCEHVWPRRDMRHVLRRAVGLDEHLVVDFSADDVRPGDLYVMMSDGVWEVLGDVCVGAAVRTTDSPSSLAAGLVERSAQVQRAYYGRNDATAAAIRIASTASAPG